MEKKGEKRGTYLTVFSVFLILLLISIASAGFSDWFKSITGKAPQEQQDISIKVKGANPVTVDIQESTIPFDDIPTSRIDPLENSVKTINFNVRVSDQDGVSDIDDSKVNYEISKGATPQKTGNCVWQGDLDVNTANYSCSFDMNYYDETGDWNIQVEAVDFGNQVPQTDNVPFVYTELKSMTISPAMVNWDPAGVVPGSTNQKAQDDPVIVTNIGNYAGLAKIRAFALAGEINPAETIPADSFTAGISTGVGDPECDLATATPLQEAADIPITGASANPGPSGSNTKELYYCIPNFPVISSQTYSTQGGNKWLILY